ncbi:aminoglycoside phosphotransferase family protein [Exiguobacterium sp. s142]|uniref:aminoglycoside phosphotransferase family protein n=1 Tax=Exiguobacterium sp. s142 TaxID=2751222 RepID=UPI001BE55F77
MRDAIPWRDESYREQFEHWLDGHVPGVTWRVVKDTDLTYLMYGEYGADRYYAKAVTAISGGEAELSMHLAERHPGLVPEVIAIAATRNWLLMRDIGGDALREYPKHSRYKAAVRQYAKLQRKEANYMDTLLAYGIPDRRPARLKEEIRTYLPELCTGLDRDKAEAVLALQDELLTMCDELATGLPMSLEHGDLHGGNIFWREQKDDLCILDWGDATVTHPFFSVRVFWNALYDLLPEDDEVAWYEQIQKMRTVYLAEWEGVAPRDVLWRHLLIAEELGCVYRALSWHVYVTNYRYDPSESADKPAQWLNLFLEYRDLKRRGT